MRIYILVDTVTEEISNMIAVPTDASAQRQCEVRQFPPGTKKNDFNLLHVGECVDHTEPDGDNPAVQGQLIARPYPKLIGTFPSEDVPVTKHDFALAKLLAEVKSQQGVEDGKQD